MDIRTIILGLDGKYISREGEYIRLTSDGLQTAERLGPFNREKEQDHWYASLGYVKTADGALRPEEEDVSDEDDLFPKPQARVGTRRRRKVVGSNDAPLKRARAGPTPVPNGRVRRRLVPSASCDSSASAAAPVALTAAPPGTASPSAEPSREERASDNSASSPCNPPAAGGVQQVERRAAAAAAALRRMQPLQAPYAGAADIFMAAPSAAGASTAVLAAAPSVAPSAAVPSASCDSSASAPASAVRTPAVVAAARSNAVVSAWSAAVRATAAAPAAVSAPHGQTARAPQVTSAPLAGSGNYVAALTANLPRAAGGVPSTQFMAPSSYTATSSAAGAPAALLAPHGQTALVPSDVEETHRLMQELKHLETIVHLRTKILETKRHLQDIAAKSSLLISSPITESSGYNQGNEDGGGVHNSGMGSRGNLSSGNGVAHHNGDSAAGSLLSPFGYEGTGGVQNSGTGSRGNLNSGMGGRDYFSSRGTMVPAYLQHELQSVENTVGCDSIIRTDRDDAILPFRDFDNWHDHEQSTLNGAPTADEFSFCCDTI